MSALVAIITGLLGILWYGNSKRKASSALDENAGTLEQLHTDNDQLTQNQGKLDGEEATRSEEEKKVENAKKDTDINNVVDFLNRLNSKK